MINLLNQESEHVVLMVPKDDLVDAIRTVITDLIAEREEQKKEALLTRKAVSERLNVDNSTLWRWAKDKFLVPVHIGKFVYYKESDVLAIEEGRI